MAYKLKWETRHTFWAIIAVLVGGLLVWNRMTGPADKPKPLPDQANQPAANANAGSDDGNDMSAGGDWAGYPSLGEFEGPYRADTWSRGQDGSVMVRVIVEAARVDYRVAGVTTEDRDAEALTAAMSTFFGKHPLLHLMLEPAEDGDRPDAARVAWVCGANPEAGKPGQPPYFLLNEYLVGSGSARFDRQLSPRSRFALVMLAFEMEAQRQRIGIWATEEPQPPANE